MSAQQVQQQQADVDNRPMNNREVMDAFKAEMSDIITADDPDYSFGYKPLKSLKKKLVLSKHGWRLPPSSTRYRNFSTTSHRQYASYARQSTANMLSNTMQGRNMAQRLSASVVHSGDSVEDMLIQLPIQPGDLVEFRTGGLSSLVLMTKHSSGRFTCIGVNSRGMNVGFRPTKVVYWIRQFALHRDMEKITGWTSDEMKDKLKRFAEAGGMSELEAKEFMHKTQKLVRTFEDEAKGASMSHTFQLRTLYNTLLKERRKSSKLSGSLMDRDSMAVNVEDVAQKIFGDYIKQAKSGKGVQVRGSQTKKMSPYLAEQYSMYATYQYLIKEAVHFIPDQPGLALSRRMYLRDPDEVALLNTVTEWTLKGSKELKEFHTKVKSVIAYSRKYTDNDDISAAATTNNGKLDTPKWLNDIKWTDSDRTLLRFVQQFVNYETDSTTMGFLNPFMSLAPTILKPLRTYGNLTRGSVTQFLIDAGVWHNWENPFARDSTVPIEGLGMSPVLDAAAKSANTLIDKLITAVDTPRSTTSAATATSATPATSAGDPELQQYLNDPVDAVRVDFGNVPVYTVDDIGAHEIDDGVSIERIPSTSGDPANDEVWIHVHIADPTSMVTSNSPMAAMARIRGSSLYLPERFYSMLPHSLVARFLSLDAREQNGTVKVKALTFSARLDQSTGDIIDYKVRPTLLRNVSVLKYDDVDAFLKWDTIYGGRERNTALRRHRYKSDHPEGPVASTSAPTAATTLPTPEPIQRDMIELQAIATRHYQQRIQNGAYTHGIAAGEVSISNSPLPKSPVDLVGPSRVLSTLNTRPVIGVHRALYTASPARMLVAELMILAGRIAARFTRDNNIPTPYRVQQPPDFSNLKAPDEIPNLDRDFVERFIAATTQMERDRIGKEYYDSILPGRVDPVTGQVGLQDFDRVRTLMQPARLNTQPGPHKTMGIVDGYVRVTSPLRRYTDMLAHWQIKSAFTPKDTFSNRPPPMTMEEIEREIPSMYRLDASIESVEENSNIFWISRLMQDWHRYDQRQYLGSFDGIGNIEGIPESAVDYSKPYSGKRTPGHRVYEGNIDLYDPAGMSNWVRLEFSGVKVRLHPHNMLHKDRTAYIAGRKVWIELIKVNPGDRELVGREIHPDEIDPNNHF
ncbi:RNB-domain-containing protein [Ramicandelaber brevisporus]|nr:RNB-domain-containing protein [Ramicandelaber brevisporus]